MTSIELLPGAQKDYDKAFDWYSQRSEEAARKFAVAVQSALQRICQGPDRLSRMGRIHRECFVVRFPYRIIYRAEVDKVVVVAVAHAKRRSHYWRKRK